MSKNKKQKIKFLKDFKANQRFFIAVTLVFVLSVSAFAILYSSYNRLDFLASGYFGNQALASQSQQILSEEALKMHERLSSYENYIKSNMSSIVPEDIGSVTVDGISFVQENRALIFYHNQVDNFISEVVLNLKDENNLQIAKVYLKNHGDKDYSQGVYGADPN